MVFGLRSGDLCLCFDWWWHLLVFWWMTFCQNGWLMGFIPRNANIYQTSNGWASSPTNVYFTIRDFIRFAPSVAWLVSFAPSVAWLVRFGLSVVSLVGFASSVVWVMSCLPLMFKWYVCLLVLYFSKILLSRPRRKWTCVGLFALWIVVINTTTSWSRLCFILFCAFSGKMVIQKTKKFL